MNKLLKCLLLAALFPILLTAQTVNDTIPRIVGIHSDVSGNTATFTPEAPPLQQIAGAPKAFYTYFWEFGDGNYSKQQQPKHTYKDKGDYQVRLWTTNNYDNGKPPTSRPQGVAVSSVTDSYTDEATLDEHFGFHLLKNREPMPDQEMLVVVSYKNEKEYVSDGKLYLFYNELKYKADNFELLDTRTYHDERKVEEQETLAQLEHNDSYRFLASSKAAPLIVQLQDTITRTNLPLTLEESKAFYKNWSVLEFDGMDPGEERNVFHTLKTTPEMLKDTTAIITLRGVYVPDRNYDEHKVKDLEMEIVTSHDPNKMSTSDAFINYRRVRSKVMDFKIRFQNDGEGPARMIQLETDIPEMFDKSTLKVKDMYPKCEICPDEQEVSYSCLDTIIKQDQIIFKFKNIYLPGSQMKKEVAYDSTQGFVKYSLKFGKNFHKKKSRSRTAIIFDKNEPIITNYAANRFLPGISIGAKAGYNLFPELDNSRSYFVGATLSPYKSYRWYWQSELMLGTHDFDIDRSIQEDIVGPITDPNGVTFDQVLRRTTITGETSRFNVDVVPISIRYNFNAIVGVGAGPQLSLDLSNKQTRTLQEEYFLWINNMPGDPITDLDNIRQEETSESFSDIRYGLFADITLGASRIGPSAGIRYVYNVDEPQQQWQFYAIWKF